MNPSPTKTRHARRLLLGGLALALAGTAQAARRSYGREPCSVVAAPTLAAQLGRLFRAEDSNAATLTSGRVTA